MAKEYLNTKKESKEKTSGFELKMAQTVLRKCSKCSEQHEVFYKVFKDGSQHLTCYCPTSTPRTTYLPYEDIPTLPVIHS